MRDYDPDQAIPAMEPHLDRVARKIGPVLLSQTLAKVLSQHDQKYVAIGVGTSGNAHLHNPTAEVCGGAPQSTRSLAFPAPRTKTSPPARPLA